MQCNLLTFIIMDVVQGFAPVIHTGFESGYTKQQMKDFVSWCHDRGYSGFSTEGKSEPRTNDIDSWIKGFISGLQYAAEEAEAKGLDVWLFDEWGYPTGTAAGKTMKGHTEWRSKKLHLALDIPLEQGQSLDITTPPHFIAAAAWYVGRDIFGAPISEDIVIEPVDGRISYTATRKRERFCAVTWEYDCFRTVGVFIPDPSDDAQGTLDLLNRDAVAFFISQMHESYAPLLSKYFGSTIKGFFYDEPFVSFPFPYTFDIFDEFREQKGYDIIPRLPRMLAGVQSIDAVDDTSLYRDVCTTRVSEAFYGQMADWCHKHELEMIGHQDLDHSISSLDSVSGHFFKNSAFNDAPGVDYIWAQLQPDFFADFPRLAGSAARLMGKRHAISESFAATSSCLYPDYMRFCMEYQIVRGISRFFLMIADPLGDDKAYNTPVSKQHPISEIFMPKLNRRIALTNMLAQGSRPMSGTAIYIPMNAVFRGLLHLKNPSSVSVAPYLHVWEYINQAAELLCHLPMDFDYIWKEALRDLPIENGAFVTKFRQRVTTLIVPPGFNDEEANALIGGFIEKGGRVIFIANPPKPLIGMGITCPDIGCLREYVEPDIALSNPQKISVAHRMGYNIRGGESTSDKEDETELFFLLNEDVNSCETEIELGRGGNILRYDFDNELWVDIKTASFTPFMQRFEPMQLMVFAVSKNRSGNFECVTEMINELTDWTAALPDGGYLKLPMLTDWREFYKKDYSGWMSYSSRFNIQSDGLFRIDLGRVCYSARLWIDEREYVLAFAPYILDLALSAGSHEIKVDVLNTSANEFFGTPKAELDNYDLSWFKTKIGSDRKYLASGLIGPVRLFRIINT